MELSLTAPLGNVITDDGRVNVTSLARSIDVGVPVIARLFGRSARYLHDHPTAKSFQPRALVVVDRINALAQQLGGVKFALMWLNMLTAELGGESAMDLLTSGDARRFEVAIHHIDSNLKMDPD